MQISFLLAFKIVILRKNVPRQSLPCRFMKKSTFTLFFLLTLTKSFAQSDTKNLYPIEVKRKFLSIKFIYDRQTIENPLALQIPMLQARDTEVNVEFLKFKQQQKMAQAVNLASVVITFYSLINRQRVSNDLYWTTFAGTTLISAYLNVRSNKHLEKSINRYNEVVSQNKIGLMLDKSFQNQAVVGLGFSHSF